MLFAYHPVQVKRRVPFFIRTASKYFLPALTSILMLFVFHGFALGLYGELTRPQLYIVVLITWAIMLLWSKAWLSKFRFGPLEWLWRCLTYGRLFPIRRQSDAG